MPNRITQLIQLRGLHTAFFTVLLGSCSSLDTEGMRPVSSTYCDNFIIYDMCARDTNNDGVVEFVYFTDSNEIFMYREGADVEFPENHGVHRCVQPMDPELVATTSRLFYINEETTALQKQDIRGAMLIKYISYMPRVTACNMRATESSDTPNVP